MALVLVMRDAMTLKRVLASELLTAVANVANERGLHKELVFTDLRWRLLFYVAMLSPFRIRIYRTCDYFFLESNIATQEGVLGFWGGLILKI